MILTLHGECAFPSNVSFNFSSSLLLDNSNMKRRSFIKY